MEFDINKLSEEFKNTIDWMSRERYGKNLKNDLKFFKNNKISLDANSNSPYALREIIGLIITKGRRLREPKDFDSKMDSFIKKHGTNIKTSAAKKELIKLFKHDNQVERLFSYASLRDFTDNLYELAIQGKTDVLGEKGRDNYLRDFGYYDRIPIDRHQKRFIVRTGIYHICSIKEKSDLLQNNHLHDALTRFCSEYLKGYRVNRIDFGDAPGILDIFIWTYCSEERYNICGSSPNCSECKLDDFCLFSLLQTKGRINTH
jgi:hypothetical protein